MRVYQNIHKVKQNNETPWVFTIVRNVVYDYYRKKKMINKYIENQNNLDGLESEGESPEHFLLTDELYTFLELAISKLPDKLKEVFLLRFEAELKFNEIAEILNCPVNSLLGRMHLAIKQLRKEMHQHLKEEYNEL